jgi:hypothetical protein
MTTSDFAALNDAGLNLQAVFDLDELPVDIAGELRRSVDPAHRYRQLILIGHAGTTLWNTIKDAGLVSENPIDDFSVDTFRRWFADRFPGSRHHILYPGDIQVGLQALGKMAGWHHPSPFMIGIREDWGTWYAYRVAALADTDLAPTPARQSASPCERCVDQPCIAACPAGAMSGGNFALARCVDYRKGAASRCRTTCIARISCPVGKAHRYSDEQIRHTYSISLQAIERHA